MLTRGAKKMDNFFLKKIEYRYVVAAIYAIVLFLDRLDLTIVNITLPTLAAYFKVPITHTEWVNNAFLLALAISIPISAWIGDRFGTKKIFIISTSIFGIASFLSAFSPNISTLVLMRFLQGLGGGMIIPVGMTMVYRVFDTSEYASITSFIFIPTLIAPALAPALGGLIIHFFTWQWVFLFAVPICFIAVFLSCLILKEQISEKVVPLDWVGFLLSSSAFILMLTFISALGKQGITFQTLGFLGYYFLQYEKNIEHPLIDIRFFNNTLFSQANLIQLAFQICHFGSIFLVGMYLQVGIGMSALAAGIIMGMQALGAICTSRFSVKLFHRTGPSFPIIVGFLGIAVFTLCILFIKQANMIFWGATILFMRGLFSGLCGTPIQTLSVVGFNKTDVGPASAIFNAGRQISISLGIALSSLLISYGFKLHGSENGFYYAFLLIPVVAAFGILMSLRVNNQKVLEIISKRI
jgi:EmrB/QacA subfamily drug resistance transporter